MFANEDESPKGMDGHRSLRRSLDRDTDEARNTVQELTHPHRLWSCTEILDKGNSGPKVSGIYAWYFDQLPSRVSDGSYHTFEGRYLLYVGIAPKAPPKNGNTPSKRTVLDRLKNHYNGNASSSTLRLTLGCLLATELGMELRRVGSSERMTFGADESRLSKWMEKHTRVAYAACKFPWEAEDLMIRTFSLPLNLDHNKAHPFHSALSQVRRKAKGRARNLPKV